MSRRHMLAAALVPVAIVLAGCAPISVGAHRARDVHFTSYHTFAWGPADSLPTGDPRLDHNPFFNDYLQGAVERHFSQHGIALAAVPADAHLLVHYHAAVNQRFDVSAWHDTNQAGYPEPRIIGDDESTLVIDVVDMRADRLIWRVWAQENLQNFVNDQDVLRAHVEAAVVRMFERLPI